LAEVRARIVDVLVLVIPAFILLIPFMIYWISNLDFSALATEQGFEDADESLIPTNLIINVIFFIVVWAYNYFFLKNSGATIGKKVVSIKVVKQDGNDLDNKSALRRTMEVPSMFIPAFASLLLYKSGNIGFWVESTLQVLSLILFIALVIMIFADEKRQTPFDKFAKTIVVRA